MPSAEQIPRNPRVIRADAPSGADYLVELERTAAAAGLARIGVAPARRLERARAAMADRVDAGLVNGMKFTYHKPERSTDPGAHVPGARSVIVGVRSYDLVPTDTHRVPGPHARVARYAWVDHYAALKASLRTVAGRLRRDGHRAVVFADDNSVVDREVAWLAGIGWFGKNANIIVPGEGSYVVIGCIVTTADLPLAEPVEDGCRTCSRCMPACPTGAIVAPGVIDANKCLSWLLQKPGIFPREHRAALGDRIYGCDDCQTSCPFTRRSVPLGGVVTESSVSICDLLESSDADLLTRLDRWYIPGRDVTWVRRNLLINLGNTARPGDPRAAKSVRDALSHRCASIRAHAVWAAGRLGLASLVPLDDPDPDVRDEIACIPAPRQAR